MIMCLFSIPPNLNGLALMISLQVFLLYVHSSTNYGIFTVKICYPIGYILYIQQIFVYVDVILKLSASVTYGDDVVNHHMNQNEEH